MALMRCPECGREISDKAGACPHCGFPISQEIEKDEIKLICPQFPSDLSLGVPVMNFLYKVSTKCHFIKNENIVLNIPEGAVRVGLYECGIKIHNNANATLLDIHKSQIIDVSEKTEVKQVEQNKSVIGRAAVGTILLGPFGGVIGGLSGINTTKTHVKIMLVISFCDIETREPKSIFFRKSDTADSLFITKYRKQMWK